MANSIVIEGQCYPLEICVNVESVLEQQFFTAKRVWADGSDVFQNGRLSRVNVARVDTFDLLPDGTVLAWVADDGYEVLEQWVIDQIKKDCRESLEKG